MPIDRDLDANRSRHMIDEITQWRHLDGILRKRRCELENRVCRSMFPMNLTICRKTPSGPLVAFDQ